MRERRAGPRRVRGRTLRRWLLATVAALALAASLVSVVKRGEDGRRLTAEIGALEAEVRIVSDRIDAERARVDSLTATARIEAEAAALGLHRAEEAQLLQVEATGWERGEETGVSTGGGEQ